MEKTFLHGFAYDSKGGKLQGKTLLISVTAARRNDEFSKDGAIGHTMDEFMEGMKASCRYIGMKFGGIVFTGSVDHESRKNPEILEKQKEKCVKHAEEIVEKIKEISNEK